MTNQVVIIGSGPAGYTAAIYAARAMLNPVMVTGHLSGGQLMLTTDVENFPGYADPVSGPKLMEDLRLQAANFGTTFISANVTSVDCAAKPFRLTLSNDEIIESRAIIIATGAKALWLNLKGEERLHGRGLSACATCDGAFFKDEDLLVVGGGDSAMEEAMFLTRYANKVTIVHRRDEFRASKIMINRALKNPKIEWITSAIVTKWLSTDKGDLTGAVLSTPTGEKTIHCGGAFIAIGHRPATDFLQGQINLDSGGYIVHNHHTMTSVHGIFACGDVVDTRYKQAITAAAQGCQAAIDCEKWLEALEED